MLFKMRILIVSQYFWPENFRINDICLGLKDRGHSVTVLTGIPNYPKGDIYDGYINKNLTEDWNGIKIYRSKLVTRGKGGGIRLFLNYISFAIFASFRSFWIKEKFDRILVFEPSPITVGIPAIVLKYLKKASISFWVQDLWPASLNAAGGVSNKFVLSFFNMLTKFIYHESKYILIQSLAFKEYILKQGVNENKIRYVPNSTEEFYFPKKSDKYQDFMPKGFKILFAGNLGEAQSLLTLVEAAKKLVANGLFINWILIGEGRNKVILEKKVAEYDLENYVHFLGKFPASEMADFFSCADALYVSLKDDYIFSLTIPSKVQSYLACGKPIIASLNGEGARIVEESGAGFSSIADDPNELVEIVTKMYNLKKEERDLMGLRGLEYFEREFKRSIVLDKIEDSLKQ